jgi:hypothetical protein
MIFLERSMSLWILGVTALAVALGFWVRRAGAKSA